MPWSVVARVTLAFLYGVMLGVLWECASLGVLLLATLLEHFCGTLVMSATFIGTVAFCLSVAASAGLIRPLLSIFAFRISAQITMAIGTGSVRRPPRTRTAITRHDLVRTPFPSLAHSPTRACLRHSSCSRPL